MCEASITPFGVLADGQVVEKIQLSNGSGMSVSLVTLGAAIISVHVPDRSGHAAEVTLARDTLDGILLRSRFYGVTVGRCANRIAKGAFEVDGTAFQLARNNAAGHALHGGVKGFDKRVWAARVFVTAAGCGVAFTRTSPDGEEGYPGTLEVTATYTLSSSNELRMEFTATTDAPTPVNLCNHAYWNLSGDFAASVKDHVLASPAPYYVAVGPDLIPTGDLPSVEGTPFDFREPKPVGRDLLSVVAGGEPGFDHSLALVGPGEEYDATVERVVIDVVDPVSGRRMVVSTTQPGVHFYTANFLKGEAPHAQHYAMCLETCHYPDSVHQPAFPTVIVRPGEPYTQVTTHKFSVVE